MTIFNNWQLCTINKKIQNIMIESCIEFHNQMSWEEYLKNHLKILFDKIQHHSHLMLCIL